MCNHKWMAFGVDSGGQYRICSKCNMKVYIISNADRIRAMSDDELAEFLAEEQFRIANVVFQTVGYGLEKQAIYVRRLNWLQQPAEEDT